MAAQAAARTIRQRLVEYACETHGIAASEVRFEHGQVHIGARTIDALWKAIGDICALYTEQECWNYLKDAGYASD